MRDKIKVVGLRMPKAAWKRLQQEAKAERLPDAAALIRSRMGLPQPGDPEWPSQARKRVIDAEGGDDDDTVG